MTYEQIKEAFLRYEERRNKLNLLYIELMSTSLIAQELVIPDDRVDRDYSLHYFDTTIITSLLPDIYGIIHDDYELLGGLLKLRIQLADLNSKISMLHSQALIPLNNVNTQIEVHNLYVRKMINDHISPLLTKVMNHLETRYEMSKPFRDSDFGIYK
ncbi:MAG: hypothetical protein DLM72_17175 [Candidatus Nitrosopolaris wilkensis]|nr:MAG: hypothetical protein DLM72_17175 [Candidatus Nitrosopolaris wilkensis]